MTTIDRTLRFGVNYVPSSKWWYCWVDWDAASIADDLHAIASLGMDHLRVMCLWPIFQPNAGYVSHTALDRLQQLLDLADSARLDVEVTVLNGWLSGFAFHPAWRGDRNIFTDPHMIDAEEFLLRTIARRVAGHPRFLGFDLGNELSVLQSYGNRIPSLAEGDAWHRRMMDLCEELAPGKLHVNGVDHQQWFMDTGFSRECLATAGPITSLHTYIEFTGARSLYRPMEHGCLHLAEYCIELAKAYSPDPARPIWLQEFGASSQWMPAEVIPDFAEQTIRNAASCAGLWGFTWWCSHDLNTGFTGFNPLEYDLGLLDQHNRLKPIGRRISQLASEFRSNPPPVADRPVALVQPDDIFSRPQPGKPAGWQFAGPYMDMIAQGIRPAVVLASRAADNAHLASRGIRELRLLQ